MRTSSQLILILIIYFAYTALILAATILMRMAEIQANEIYEMISGVLLGFIAIPIFAVLIPLWLANRWKLTYSFLPRIKTGFLRRCRDSNPGENSRTHTLSKRNFNIIIILQNTFIYNNA
ncbi:MAG: hypothetical protein HQ591_02630 [candidate division Zixibacteria bacterium]|nr:hypothetical protein [Candidatus Tariuqbacter arcticus]